MPTEREETYLSNWLEREDLRNGDGAPTPGFDEDTLIISRQVKFALFKYQVERAAAGFRKKSLLTLVLVLSTTATLIYLS